MEYADLYLQFLNLQIYVFTKISQCIEYLIFMKLCFLPARLHWTLGTLYYDILLCILWHLYHLNLQSAKIYSDRYTDRYTGHLPYLYLHDLLYNYRTLILSLRVLSFIVQCIYSMYLFIALLLRLHSRVIEYTCTSLVRVGYSLCIIL